MKRRGAPWPLLLLLLLAAIALCWWLLRPTAQNQTVTPVATPTTAASPSGIPTSPSTASPTISPTAAVSATVTASSTPAAVVTGARLAIIIDDCGQWLDTERALIALPIPLTLSVLPYVRYTSLISQEASGAGQGVMLHLPMEPMSGINPGPGEIKTTMTDAEITSQVDADLAQVPLAQGVNNHEGSKATSDQRVMEDVARAIAQHGNLFFIDSLTIGSSVAAAETRDAGIPTASRDVFLDNQANVDYTEGQLRDAAAVAQRQGTAIAIGHPRPTTLAALRAMIPQLQAEGIRFVLVRDIVR